MRMRHVLDLERTSDVQVARFSTRKDWDVRPPMSQDHRLQQQRFELKYLIDESVTMAMRDFVSCYLELDEYGIGKPNLAYPVHSIYFDSDELATHQWTVL